MIVRTRDTSPAPDAPDRARRSGGRPATGVAVGSVYGRLGLSVSIVKAGV